MRVIEIPQYSNWYDKLKYGLALSLLLHIMFLFIILKTEQHAPKTESFIEVSIVPEELKKEDSNQLLTNQIVEQPQAQDSPENKQTNAKLLSDKDSYTEKEQIKRGDRPDAAPVKSNKANEKPIEKQNKQQPKEEQKTKTSSEQPADKISTLRLDDQTLFEKFAAPKSSKSLTTNESSYQAFSRPAGSGAAFIGMSGTSDFLPNLPDGDITLLNTKADKFAVFVRRVASLVFSHMRSTGWETLQSSDIEKIEDYCTVHAVLDKSGKLIKISIEGSSGSRRFDETLSVAVKSGAHDPNPPAAAAAEDGNYHFIFKSKSWSKIGHAPKTGAPYERRWLLLSTGLL